MSAARRVLPVTVLLAALVPLALPPPSSAATTFIVTLHGDPTPNGCNNSGCSLREAVIAANNTPGADTIKLKNGDYTLAIATTNEDQSVNGDLDIRKSVTIVGRGKLDSTVDGNDLDRVFDVFGGIDVTFSQFGITGGMTPDSGGGIFNRGHLVLKNVDVNENVAQGGEGGGIRNTGRMLIVNSRVHGSTIGLDCCGGGIFNNKNLTIRRSRIDHNDAQGCCGGGIYNGDDADLVVSKSSFDHNDAGGPVGCCGGAIYSEDAGSTVLIKTTRFSNNSTAPDCCGGALYNDADSKMTVRRSKLINNTASDCGGGIYNKEELPEKATLKVVDSLLKGNDGGTAGGGICNSADGAKATITNTTLVGNEADIGGGISSGSGASLILLNSTFSGNTADSNGGGLYQSGATVTMTHTTVAHNDAGSGGGIYSDSGTINIVRSIVGLNTPEDCDPSALDSGLNLDSDSTCFTGGAARHGNLRLRPLDNYGGPTPTHALKPTSKAVDAVPGSVCPPPKTDQRHVKRPQDGDGNGSKRCDLGSFERK